MNSSQQRVLVTGGTSGIGRELVQQLCDRGDAVFTCGRSRDRLDSLLSETGAEGMVVDLAELEAASKLVSAAVDTLGGLDLVIANAGVQVAHDYLKAPTHASLAALAHEVAINLTSPALLAAAAMPELARSGGAFAGISSGLAYSPKKSAPLYCATKAGLNTFLGALRYQAEDSPTEVTVHEIVLPVVATEMTAGRNEGEMSSTEAATRILDGIGRGRPRVAVGKARLLLALSSVFPGLGRRLLRNG